MEHTKIFHALKGVRGRQSVDMAQLEAILVKLSRLVIEQPWIKELDINPLSVSAERIIALDARVVVHPAATKVQELPKPVIRPYPLQFIWQEKMKDGTPVTVRPIRPEDEPAIVEFHRHLSEQTVYFRFFRVMDFNQRVAHERLTKICFIDYDHEIALVVERQSLNGCGSEILGVGRLAKSHDKQEGEFAVLVVDHLQRQGLGTMLLNHILDVARAENVKTIVGSILIENIGMLKVSERLGFKITSPLGDDTATATIGL
jgi:acetyltransferase